MGLACSTSPSVFLWPKPIKPKEMLHQRCTYNQIANTNFFPNKQMEERKLENQISGGAAVNRYKILWRVFLIGNFGLGAYMFAQAGKKERVKEKKEATVEVTPTPTPVTTLTDEEPIFIQPTTPPVIVRQPIPEDQQRELFKWMLEEKRMVKPNNREKKLRIDKEKAILKEFLRAKSIPSV